MKEYTFAIAYTLDKLKQAINDAAADGWKPHGNHVATPKKLDIHARFIDATVTSTEYSQLLERDKL